MILIGQYDSPFVRRVGIALTLYGLAFEHRPWSAFADAYRIRPHNPLGRVPALLLDDGEALIDSHYILDYLDSLVPEAEALAPRREPQRHRVLKIAALATGLGDKAVNLFYEQRMHNAASDIYVHRLRAQIDGALDMLEAERSRCASPYFFGDRLSHADIAVGCVWHFVMAAHPRLVPVEDYANLAALSERLEALPAFRAIHQPFVAPA
jgi:glutathione S-transferase